MRRSLLALALALATVLLATASVELLRPAAPAEVVTAGFDFRRGALLLPARVGGQGPFHFLLDTGTDPSVLDEAVARSLGIWSMPVGPQGSGLGGERIDVSLLTPLEVAVDGLPPRRLLALGLDLSVVSERMGTPMHGILGHNFLNRYRLEIDFPARQIRFLPGGREWSWNRSGLAFEASMEFLPGESFPLLPDVEVNGVSLRATLDTGSNCGITLYGPATELLELGEAAQSELATAAGFGGVVGVRKGTVESVKLGPLQLKTVSACFVLEGHLADTPLSARGANLGNDALKELVVGLDYPGRRVRIWRADETEPAR